MSTFLNTYSTEEAAKAAGVHRVTLARWLSAGKVKPSIQVKLANDNLLHRWTDTDVARLKEFSKEHKNKGRAGRPPKKGKTK